MKKTLTCLGLVVLMYGCMTSASTVVYKMGPDYKVTENSKILSDYVQVTERSVTTTPDGVILAQIRGKNLTRRDVQLEYRLTWLDKDGIEIDTSATTWTPVAVAAMGDMFLKGVCPARTAVDFLMEIRFPYPSTRW